MLLVPPPYPLPKSRLPLHNKLSIVQFIILIEPEEEDVVVLKVTTLKLQLVALVEPALPNTSNGTITL